MPIGSIPDRLNHCNRWSQPLNRFSFQLIRTRWHLSMKKEAKIYLCLILLFPLWVLWGCAHFVGYRYPTFSSKEAKEHYIKAYRYFDSQRYDLAIPELQIVVDLEPQNSEGHASLGVCYARTNRFNAAVSQYLQAIEIDSAKGEYHLFLSDAYYDLGLLDKCIEEYEKGDRFHIYHLLRFVFEFLLRYIVKLGVLDGIAGFTHALLSSFYASCKHLKLWELEDRAKKSEKMNQ